MNLAFTGALFSVNGVLEKVCNVLGALALNSIYAASEGVWPGMMYAALAVSQTLALFLAR